MPLLNMLLEHWLTSGQRAQEAQLKTLQLETLKKKLAQETAIGESYPTGFEPIPATQEPVQLTPQEVPIQEAAYTPPPETPVQTKPGYKGMTMKDIGALHQIGLSALPPTEARPRGQVLPTGLLKSVEAPAIHYETVKDEEGNAIGTNVFEGGKLKTRYDVTGKEMPFGEGAITTPSTAVRYTSSEEAIKAYGPPKTEGFVVKAKPISNVKGKITGYTAEEIADPTFTAEFKSFETWLSGQGIDPKSIKGTPQYAAKYKEYKAIGPEVKADVEAKDLLTDQDANWLAGKLASRQMVPSQLRSFIGFGAVGQKNLSKVMKNLRKNNPEYNFALAELAYTGDKTEINKNKSLQGNIMSFEKTAIQNAKQVDALSRKIDVSRIPALNAMILTGKIMVGGTPIEAQYLASWRTIVNEYARIATSVSGGGVTSDTARKEIESILKASYTPEQIQAVVRQLVLEMEHRRYGFEKNLHDVMINWGESPTFAPKLPTAEDIEALFQTPTPLVGAAGVGKEKTPLGSFWK